MTSSSFPSPYPSPGEIIDGKYQIERVLGEGGMGCVARAYHMLLRAPVALKFMNPQFVTFPGAVERFINEGIASKKIKSDHVVPVDDVGKLPSGAPYLVMPCLEGMDLADLLARDGTPGLPAARAVHFTLQILRGLQAAHANAIIHRDMKPSNCFVVKHDGESDFVRILDFGISKVVEPGSASLTRTNSALGTPLYMSPEQARSPRDVDTRSDLYSVGVILYELLTGETPFFSEDGEFTEILYKLFTTDPPPIRSKNPDIDEALAAVVHHALARSPADRYATALEMAEALASFADERSARVLGRMRGFKPEQVVSLAPPAHLPLPNSLVAFSKLDARPATDVMANRPGAAAKGAGGTEILMPVSGERPGTEVLVPAPSTGDRAPGTELLERKGVRSPTVPLPKKSASEDDGTAQTQFGDFVSSRGSSVPAPGNSATSSTPRVVVAGAQTDLGATRDTHPPGRQAPTDGEKKGALPRVIGIGAVVVALVAGAVVMAKKNTGADETPPSPATGPAATALATTPNTPATPATIRANVGDPASGPSTGPATGSTLGPATEPSSPTATNAAPDAGAQADAGATSSASKPAVKPAGTRKTPGTPGGDALDLGIQH